MVSSEELLQILQNSTNRASPQNLYPPLTKEDSKTDSNRSKRCLYEATSSTPPMFEGHEVGKNNPRPQALTGVNYTFSLTFSDFLTSDCFPNFPPLISQNPF